MKILMDVTCEMPNCVFLEGKTYDTDVDTELTEGQAKTFCICGLATEVTEPVIPSGAAKPKPTTKKKVK
jgi:hypothetical protein